jgi:hypothetical protein
MRVAGASQKIEPQLVVHDKQDIHVSSRQGLVRPLELQKHTCGLDNSGLVL